MYFIIKASDIRQILDDLHIERKSKGYSYLMDAISMAYDYPHKPKGAMGKIYDRIAKKHETTSASVERCIRYTIEKAWISGDNIESIVKYFGSSVDGKSHLGRPSNRDFIVGAVTWCTAGRQCSDMGIQFFVSKDLKNLKSADVTE